MKREVYDYMAGKADVYKGVKETGYEGFTKAMENGDYRKRVYDALKATGAWTYDYETFDKSWNAPEQPAAGAGETGAVNGDVEPVLDINSTRILGAEDFERYEAEQKPSSTMDTYDYEKMRVDPEKERQRLDAFRGELEEEGVNSESVYAAIDAGEKEIEKGWQEAQKRRDEERREDSRVPVGPNFARVEGMYEDTPAARDLSNFSLAKDLYDDARNLLDASFKGSGFGRGVWDAVYDVDAWTAGLAELGKNVQLNRVYEKAKKGEELTASEARLLDAANYYTLAGALQQAYLPSEWYRWGQGFGGSVPYMLQFALTYGPASSVTKGLARAVFKKLGGGTVGRVAGEVTHGMTTSAVQTPLNATNVASDTYRRMMGNAEVAVDENGVPVFMGMTDQKGFWQALGEATGAQYIENLSEVSGRMLSGAGHLIKRTAPRYVQKGLEKIADNRYVRAMADNAFTRGARKVGKRFKIGNAPEEIYEEYFGGTINGLLIGDTDLESLYSMQSFVDITGTVAVTQVFLGAVGASMNHRSKRSLVKQYEKAEREYDALFSSPEERDMYVSYVNLNLNGVQGKGGKPMLTVLREAVEKMVNSHGDNFVRADGTFDTEAAKAYREEVSRVFGNYFVAKQLYDSYMAGIRTRKEADRERIATEMQEKAVNGQIMTVTLADGRRARVVSGDIVVDGDGRIDVGRSGDHFTAVYEDDGSTVQLPVEDSYTVEVVSVEDAVEAASRANDELINREEEEAVYGPRPKLGETVTMLDSEGNRVQLVVSGEVDEMGNFMAMPMEDFDNNVNGMAVAVNMSQIVRDDAASEGVDGANEYQSFVNEGTVSDATVERIAGKIANGESLTAEEEAMRQGANERVEGALVKLRDMEGEKQEESALSRIEKDAKGQPLYEKADVETAWDALVEQSEGDESIARDVAASMVKDKEAALKKMEKAPAKGATPAEKIADAKMRKENIDKARAELEHWQAIAGVPQTRADGQTEGNAVQTIKEETNTDYEGEERIDVLAGDNASGQGGQQSSPGRVDTGERDADGVGTTDEIGAGTRSDGFGNTDRGGIEGAVDEGQSGLSRPEVEVGLNEVEASDFMAAMEAYAVERPIMELNPSNWEQQFGTEGKVSTPIGTVKMGENQISKLFEKGRSEQFGMIKPTLETPLAIIEVPSEATGIEAERASSLLFVKTFIGKNGEKIYYFKSVTVKKDGMEVSVSSHYDRPKRIKDALINGKLLYRFDGGAQTEHHPADASVTASRIKEQGISTSESIERIGEKQGKSEENAVISSEEDIDVTVGRVMEIPDAGDRSALVSGLLASAKAEEKSVSRVKNKVDPRNTQAFLAEQQRIRGEQDKARAEVAYWEEVKRIVEESNATESAPAETSKVKAARPKSIRERISALGEVLNLRDYILRALATGEYKFIWGDNRNGTKGLGSHLGFGNNRRGIEERQRRIWLLNNEEGLYPEQVAERLYANIQAEYPYLAQDDVEVFNEMLDVLRYDSAKDMVSEAEDMRRRREEMYEEYDSDQAMYDATMQERDERVDAENEAYRRELESQESGTPAEGRAAEPLGDTVAAAEAEVNTNPTEKQKEAGNYRKGHVRIDGFNVTIENPKGSIRSGVDATGKEWSITMNNTYGYMRGTQGVDGDYIDVFLSDNPDNGNVYIVDQINQETGEFDEHKVMYGFNSMEEAKDAYLSNYSEGWKIGNVTEVSKEEFKKWVNSSHRKTKPFAEYSSIKTISGESGDAVTDNLTPNTEPTAIQGFDGYSQSEIKSIVQEYIQQKLDENDISANVVGIAVHGSRVRGNAKENSDLDVVVEYEGDIREDGMFNLLNYDDNDEALYIEGIRVDINPIRAQETGTLDKYMERSRKYDEEVLSNDSVEDSTVRYRRGEDGVQGVRRTQESEMEREVRGFGERMADRLGGGVRLVYSDEIADSEAHAEEKRRSKGYYDTATGEVVVVLDNNTVKGVPSVIEVAMTMMHEVVGHKGVRGLFGTKEDAFLDDVYRGMKARTRAEMESLYGGQLRRRAGESEEAFEARRRRLMADEYIARVAEEGNNPGLLRRVGAKVRGLLRGLGVELAITDNEIRDILRRSARELTRRKDGAMNVREDGDVRYRESVNERFNKELEQQIDGTLPKGHIYQLGLPGEILRSTGIPDLPIELSSARLAEKAAQRNHEFELSDVKGLPEALENPIAIFSYGNKDKAQNIIVEIEKAGKKFVVGLHLNQDRRGILVNDIRGIFPKDNAEWLNWISQGKLLYVDKNKIQDLIDKQRTNLAEVEYLDLDSITNIVKEFENPTVGGENVRYRRGGEEETEFSKKYNLNEEDVSNYAYHMSMGNLGGATRAFHEIRRKVRIDNDGTSLGRFTEIFTPIKRELYSRFGNIDELRDSIERTNEEARKEMESVRKKAEEEAAAERRRIAVFQRMTDEQLDEEYMKAVSEKDESRLRDLVNEAARRNGYGDIDSEYQGVGAWSAPANPGYENSEIRHASYEREGGAVNVLDIEQGYSPQPDNYFTNLRVYGNDTPHGRESASAIYRAIQSIKSGKKPKIKVYRAVPSTVKEGKLRNGDWVTPSKKYAEMHGNHRLEGDYRIIEQEVSAEDLWWDGNDINEWGYDDGNSYAYRNTKNNRKLYELITRDDEGRIIPLSERFNSRREDVRYRIAEADYASVQEDASGEYAEALSAPMDISVADMMPIEAAENAQAAGLLRDVVNRFPDTKIAITDLSRVYAAAEVAEIDGDRVRYRVKSGIDTKSAPDTALPEAETSFKGTAISSADGTKILNNLGKVAKEYENKRGLTKTFIGDLADALDAQRYGSSSRYATFETVNGKEVTIRLADHNASTTKFDNAGRDNGISIVISRKPNAGIERGGDAHIVEFFYPDKALRKAEGKPLSEIVRSIEQALYSGEYRDTTGLAEREEVNAGDIRYRREVNERFNEELERQIAGELPKGHVYSLGRPSEVLLAAGIPDLPIELAASRLGLKASAEYESNHPFELGEVMNLPEAIQHPIAVFDSKTRVGSKVILVELKDRNGNNFVVAMNTNVPKSRYSKASIQINDIRSIYPKDNVRDIVGWISRGDLLRYADKKKIEDWITQQRSNSAEVEIQNLDVAANIVKEFENPAVDGENVRYRRGISFDTRGASHRDTDITGRRERSFGEKASRLKEKAGISLYDEQLKLKQLQGKVAEWLTGSRKGALDDRLLFYEAENQAGSIAMDRKVRFDNEYRERLFALRAEVFKALGNKVDDKYYFYAKTLNERTGVIGEKAMAANKATMFSHLLSEQHPGHDFPEGFFDPKEYGYEALQAYARKEGWIDSIEGYIADCESRMGEKLVSDIWGVIGEIAEYQLTTSMKKGLITRDHFDRLMYGRPLAELVRENLEKGLITEGQYRAFLATDFTADELVKAGFITREQREGLKRRYEYYLPLKGDSEPTTEEVADYERSRSRVSWQIKSVKGGNTRLVNDPVSRLLADVYASISYQEKMAWIQSMYHALRLAERQGKGAGDFAILDNWVVKDETGDYVPYVRYVEGEPVFTPTEQEIAKGEVERARNLPIETAIRVPEAVQGEHIVKLKHRGRTIHIYFRDPAVANAVNNHFVPRVSPGWLKWAHAINRFRASVYTSYNPEFVFSNLFKDFGEAAVNNYVQYGATYLKEFTKNYGRVMRHAGTTLRGAKRKLVPTNDYERRVEEFFKYGGEVSYTQIESYEKAIRDFEKELKRSADKRGVVSVTKAGFVKIGKAVSAANKLAELNARLATFITSRERGYGLRQSIRDAKEVTVNFDRRGRDSRYFGAWFLFWNAGRQSNRRKLELFLEHPGRFIKSRAVIWTVAIAKPFLLGTIMSSLFGIDWEDYMTRYFDLPDFIRYNNIVFLTADGKVYRMPLSPSFRPDMTLAENFAELIYRKVFNDKDGKYDVVKGSADILKSLSADLGDPTRWDADGKGKLVGWAPAPIMASAELLGNTDFTGRPIYKKGNTASPGYKNVYSGTNSFYVGTGKWLNRVSGGEEAYGSWLGRNVNPAVVEHYVDSWLGGLGNFAVKIYGMVMSGIDVLGGTSDTFMDGRYEQIPFVGKLYAGDAEMLGEREVRDDIYDARRLVESYNDVRSNFRKTDEDYENNPKTSQYLENNEYRIDELKDLLKKYDEVTEELKSEDSEAYRRELRLLRRSIVELTNEMEEY